MSVVVLAVGILLFLLIIGGGIRLVTAGKVRLKTVVICYCVLALVPLVIGAAESPMDALGSFFVSFTIPAGLTAIVVYIVRGRRLKSPAYSSPKVARVNDPPIELRDASPAQAKNGSGVAGAFIFISHSSKDHAAAESICAALESRGIVCWLAARDVGPGENFQQSIVRAIRTARAMVLVFTRHANSSSEINKEIALASQFNVPVIPVRIEEVMPSDALAYELATRQWIDLYLDRERALERLSKQIGAMSNT